MNSLFRDMFHVPEFVLSDLPELPLIRDIVCKDTLSERINEILYYQCNNLSCVRAKCGLHGSTIPVI